MEQTISTQSVQSLIPVNMNSTSLQSFAEQFVTSTRRYLFVRPEDGVLILYPNS